MRIFGKQLLLSLGILAISLAFLGLVLTRAISGYLTDQRKTALTDSAARVARTVESVFINMHIHGGVQLEPLLNQIENLNDMLDASVAIIIGADYEPLFWGLPDGTEIPIHYVDTILEGNPLILSGSFHPTSPESLLIAGHPFTVGINVYGVVLVSISMAELESTIAGMYQITALSLLVAAVFSAILIYISSSAHTRRLRQLHKAAEIMATGAFENRIPVTTKDEVGKLAAQVNIMAQSLHRQEKIRKEFISNLSHDIRTPLTSILGFVKALEDGTIPTEKQPHYYSVILKETERLIKLSNDFLDIHRIQEAWLVLSRTTFDINNLIKTTLDGFEQRASIKNIIIHSHFPHDKLMVRADEEKIRRCLYNLLDNAVKFTQEDGEIAVEAIVSGKKAMVIVQDNGRGIPQEEQSKVFDRFYKGDASRSEDKLGSGLGLSITKEFMLAHGEDIHLESEPDKGSTFAFTLPRVD